MHDQIGLRSLLEQEDDDGPVKRKFVPEPAKPEPKKHKPARNEGRAYDEARSLRNFEIKAPLAVETVRRTQKETVNMEIKVVAGMRIDQRALWLSQALQAAADGEVRPSDLHDIIVHPRFMEKMTVHTARQMYNDIHKYLRIFSEANRKSLGPDCALARHFAEAQKRDEAKIVQSAQADEIMARCRAFVQQNEGKFAELHKASERLVQVDVHRSGPQEVWGFQWERKAFQQGRRILEAVVPGSAAGNWNQFHQARLNQMPDAASKLLRVGDQLVAVNGNYSPEALAGLKNHMAASLTFVRAEPSEAPEKAIVKSKKGEMTPPTFGAGEGYVFDEASGWWAHATSGAWLYNDKDKAYFHVPTGKVFTADSASGGFTQLPLEETVSAKGKKGHKAERLWGRVRWFNASKGFGFIVASNSDDGFVHKSFSSEDVFVHQNSLEGLLASVPPLPGMPISYELTVDESNGKVCAAHVYAPSSISEMCKTGFFSEAGKEELVIQLAPVTLGELHGRAAGGLFCGVLTGHKGDSCTKFVTLELPKAVGACMEHRKMDSDFALRNGIQASFKRIETEFLQHANTLDASSGLNWVAAGSSVCTATMFGPDGNGHVRLVVSTVGEGGHAVLGRKSGTAVRVSENQQELAKSSKSKDAFGIEKKGAEPKAWKDIVEGSIAQAADRGWVRRPAPKGCIGGLPHNDGVVSDTHIWDLNWEEDVVLIIASAAIWEAMTDKQAVALVLKCLQEEQGARKEDALSYAAKSLVRAAGSKRSPEERTALVVRFPWCQLRGADSAGGGDQIEGVSEPVKPEQSNSKSVGLYDVLGEASGDTPVAGPKPEVDPDDIFAAPEPAVKVEDIDDMFAT